MDKKNCQNISAKYPDLKIQAEIFRKNFPDRKNKESRRAALDAKEAVEKNLLEITPRLWLWNDGMEKYRDYAEQTPKQFPELRDYREVDSFEIDEETKIQLLPNGNIVSFGGFFGNVSLYCRQADGSYKQTQKFDMSKKGEVVDGALLPGGFLVLYGKKKIFVFSGLEKNTLQEYCEPLDNQNIREFRRVPGGALVAIEKDGDISSLRIMPENEYLLEERIDHHDAPSLWSIQMLPNGGYLLDYQSTDGYQNLLSSPHPRAKNEEVSFVESEIPVYDMQFDSETGAVYGRTDFGIMRFGSLDDSGRFIFDQRPFRRSVYDIANIVNWIILPGQRLLTTAGINIKICKKDGDIFKEIDSIHDVGSDEYPVKSLQVAPDGRIYALTGGIVRIFDGV